MIFYTYSLLQYIQFFRNGKALCRPVLYWFKQNWAYNANISKWRKFEATICEICTSENSRFRRLDEIGYFHLDKFHKLFVAVIFLPGAVPKIQALLEANYSEV